MHIENISVGSLKPYNRNARTHSASQIKQIAGSIQKFQFTNPILVSNDLEIVAGHGRLLAAKQLGMKIVPVIRLAHLSANERRALVLADNKIALNGGWDQETLAGELQALMDAKFDMDVTGFSMGEIDIALDAAGASSPAQADGGDVIPAVQQEPVSRLGDLWMLGRHRLLCADAQSPSAMDRLMEGVKADLLLTDPPYNVPINGHVSGSGKVKHREFAMASGEMTEAEFTAFLATTLGIAAANARDGALAYVFMDWRHMRELMNASEIVLDGLKQLCVWNKSNGGQGSFYRSKHELVFIYKIGKAPHLNNFGLGESGRYRTNVWDYPGISSMSSTRADELAMHPTVKPLKLVIDAIEDCTRRGDIVLDCFGGSGTTLIAADRCGRTARLMEFDPLYCDVIIRRYQALTGKAAVLSGDGEKFEEISARRLGGRS
jgi:DNA modification methylase